MGRRRIKMELVKDMESRHVTFSKRRTGLFKKASELATLCAAQVCIIVFSLGGKPFSFGQPSVGAAVDRFLNRDPSDRTLSMVLDGKAEQAHRDNIEKLSQELAEIDKKLQEEKRKGEMLEKRRQKASETNLFAKPSDQLTFPELLQVRQALMEFQKKIAMRKDEMEASSSLLLLADNAPKDDAGDDDDINKN